MKKLLLLSIALLLIAGVYADVVIGSGTSAQYYPMSTYYNYYRSATLYTAAEIGATGSITSLQWYCNTANTTTSVPVVIYMKHSDATVLTTDTWANYSVNATEVYNGTNTFSATGWYTFDITDFAYNGTQNLMILIQSGSAAYVSPYVQWRYTTTATNMFARVQADSSLPTSLTASTYRPNITLVGITQTTPPGIASLVFPTPSGVTGVGITPTLSWAAGTGTPTGYDVYFGETLPAEGSPNVDHTVQTATTWGPGTLSYNTSYSWKIVPWNAYGHPTYAECPTWTFTTMIDPTKPLDYSQDFNSGTSLSAIGWTGTMYIAAPHGTAGTNGLYRNLYSSTTTATAVTPPIGPMTDDCQILFDYRIVNYSGYPATGTTLGASDKIEVQVSTDNGANFTTIYTIDQSNHVTSNAFAAVNIPVTTYNGNIIIVKFLSTWGEGDYYVDIDNVVVRATPLGGTLTVSPNPVVFAGSTFIGYEKTVQVSLTNTGVAPLDVTSIALEDYTNFQLDGLPTLSVTINPGDPAVTFNVVFAPTAEGPLSTNLLINDTRLPSSIVVNGIGAVMPVGEICENPYLATLDLVDYAGTTAGYANDYTSAMFTGLGSTYYLNGKDWVAKITLPSAGLLDIGLADQTGYSSQYMGVFLVNTIPSLASPAAVLAQAYGNATPLAINDAIVQAGDYYVIVDNWPTPADIYFVLNIAFTAATEPPSPATLVSPADAGTNIALGQTLNWTSGGGYVEGYRLSFGTVDPYAVVVDNLGLDMATTYDPELAYSTEYWWTVTPYNSNGDATPVATWTFTTMGDPTVYVPPTYTIDFETWPPLGWDLTGGTNSFVQYTDASSNNWAMANFWGQSSGKTDIMTTPPIVAAQSVQLLFTWSHLYSATYPNDALAVYMSEDLQNWGTAIWSKAGVDLDSADGATSTAPGTGVTETVPITLAASTTFYIRFLGTSGYGPDLFVDNVIVRLEPTELLAPILDSPDDTATMLPIDGFEFAWHQDTNSITPDSYKLYMSKNLATVLTDVVYTGITGTSFDPTQATPAVEYAYDDVWYWTVGAVKDLDEETAAPWTFTIQPDPTIYPEDLPWCEGFEPYDNFSIDFVPWTNVDVDGGDTYGMTGITWPNAYAPQAFIIYNPSATTPPLEGLIPHGGDKAAACFATVTASAPNNDWLITPPIVGVSGLQAKFWAMSYTADYGLERFNVGVSTTGTAPGDFTIISGTSYIEAPIEWTEYTYPLEYPGQTIYVGIQCVSYDAFFLLVDDFCLSVATLAAPEVTIALDAGVPTLGWTAVENADLYEVYGAIDPMAADPWTLLTDPAISGTSYQYTGTDAYHFFKVIALTASKREAATAKKSRIGLPTATKETNPMLRK